MSDLEERLERLSGEGGASDAPEEVESSESRVQNPESGEVREEVLDVVEDSAEGSEYGVQSADAAEAVDATEAVDDAVVEASERVGVAEGMVEEALEEIEEAVEESAEAEEAEEVEEPVGAVEVPGAVRVAPTSPYDLPGSWLVIHSYSGYENKVKANLETRIRSMHMEESIFDVVIPLEDVVEIKSGRKVTVQKKQFPGYLLVRMYLDDDSWSTVRNTPGVTGFVGSGNKPTALSRREVERILGIRKDEDEKKAPRFKPEWEVGETVRVIEGPFADFNGVIEDINIDQSKVRVLVDIFGRETPVELNFEQIQKF